MANGLKDLLIKHQKTLVDGSHDSIMTAAVIEILERLAIIESGRVKFIVLVSAIAVSPMAIMLIEKFVN